MRAADIDPMLKTIAAQKRKELEDRFLKVRLKRCEKHIPISAAWVSNWESFIQSSVRASVIDHLAHNSQPVAQNKSRTAAQNPKPATQVAQT